MEYSLPAMGSSVLLSCQRHSLIGRIFTHFLHLYFFFNVLRDCGRVGLKFEKLLILTIHLAFNRGTEFRSTLSAQGSGTVVHGCVKLSVEGFVSCVQRGSKACKMKGAVHCPSCPLKHFCGCV